VTKGDLYMNCLKLSLALWVAHLVF
jgi:hypothetical protein